MKRAILLTVVLSMIGCAQQSALQQMLGQTKDPALILLATYADAQDIYIATGQLYLPYQQYVHKAYPEVDSLILGLLMNANHILDTWSVMGDIPLEDKAAFREYIRLVTIQIAKTLELTFDKEK